MDKQKSMIEAIRLMLDKLEEGGIEQHGLEKASELVAGGDEEGPKLDIEEELKHQKEEGPLHMAVEEEGLEGSDKETADIKEEDEELKESGMAPKKGTKIDEDKGKEAFAEGLKRKGGSPLSRSVMKGMYK